MTVSLTGHWAAENWGDIVEMAGDSGLGDWGLSCQRGGQKTEGPWEGVSSWTPGIRAADRTSGWAIKPGQAGTSDGLGTCPLEAGAAHPCGRGC